LSYYFYSFNLFLYLIAFDIIYSMRESLLMFRVRVETNFLLLKSKIMWR